MPARLVLRTLCYWAIAALVLAGGCAPGPAEPLPEAETARPAAELSLLVVDDPELAEAISSLRAQWQADTGGAIVLSQATLAELLKAETQPVVDAIIYPAAALGELAARDWLAPLPGDFATNRQLDWSDTFELLQLAETQWGKTQQGTSTLAMPFGSPLLTLYYRSDLVEHLHQKPPSTWTEYHALAEALHDRTNLGTSAPPADTTWFAAAEPLAEGWAGLALLARAAAYAKHRDNYSTLFHIDTMEPLVAGAPFVRALTELVADAKLGPPNQLDLDPAGVRAEFLAGRVGLALAWPGHPVALKPDGPQPADPPATGFAELPGAGDVYNVAQSAWERRQPNEDQRVPLLGMAGRLGSITKLSAQPEAALQLLAWLSGPQWGDKVPSASPATTLFRKSQLKAPLLWVDRRTGPEAAAQYGATVHDALSRQAYLYALRIPGRQQYLAALDRAVRAAVQGEQTPEAALAAAAESWRKTTESLSRDAQRKAYRESLGLAP